MPAFYLDTSALVKRYLTEQGSEVVDSLFQPESQSDLLTTFYLTILEIHSAITRLAKGGQLRQRMADRILSKFRQDVDDRILVLPINNQIGRLALLVVRDYKLRAADALHLATTLNYRSYYSEVTNVFVASDGELLEAAKLANLAILDPTDSAAGEQLAALRA
ncbi:MAG: type II toxin-antitoxin system VapC family toxin [Chloroflexi bacterium]|nr:type II toxin-antitoxin system VapC family toxin [Chloroflexota bacterium]